jgi:uncharacterized repeat protein (TIGR01451 family)
VQAPDGTQTWRNPARDGDQWTYELPGETPGRYTLWLRAVDQAGNERTMGPYAVDVTCTDARLATTLTVERSGSSSTYLLTAVISNTGPAELPAGATVTLYAGETPLGAAQLLPALEPGQTSAVSTQWTRPGPGDHDLRAVVDAAATAVLCATPPMGTARVGPDVDLQISKTVQPPAAVPGDVITYTLVYTNAGAYPAAGALISDPLPAAILEPSYLATGAAITPTGGSGTFAWEVADLAGGLGGRIVISGTIDPAVNTPSTVTNVVTITSPLETSPGDNVASVMLPVVPEVEQPEPRSWLPLIVCE